MDEDLFDAFDEVEEEDDEVMTNHNPMANLENKRAEEARVFSAQLLSQMMSGDTDATIPAKRQRMEDDVEDEVGESDGDALGMRVHVHPIDTNVNNCTHEVALPPEVEFRPLDPRATEPAKKYEFQLDGFQKEAIQCIDNNQSVLVSAHTSAGKTVVALYAIAQCLRDKQRVIYTSPIKALSNQKFRELEEEFKDVGLMTGDVTLNPDASCLVMTTEILRSMLYRGSQMMREVGWVIFDEIHYMRDKERGVVWEESIILLPDSVHHVFLSATIPNARQFAEWVCWLHDQPCHVVYTDYRPTPLQHFIYPAGGSGLYEVVNIQGVFREDKFAEAMSGLAVAGDAARGGFQRGKKGGRTGENESNVMKIIRTVKERDMIPCIIFSFSRKECEAYALGLKDMDFNSESEKGFVRDIFKSAIDLLSDEDRKLPQIGQVLPLLERGIGIHHSGLLPILKETVEILFGEGLIKALFATETFAMGLNMPAKTVIFTSARKFDGKENRWVTSGEYIQMSGRAGRRGKDDRGLVILMVDQQLNNDDARHIIKGATDPLNSQFRLTYNMVLNLLRVEGIDPTFMLQRSFYQFQNHAAIPGLKEKIIQKTEELDAVELENESDITAFFEMERTIESTKNKIREKVMAPVNLVPFLHAGRLLKIITGARDFDWGALVNFQRKVNPDDTNELIYIIEVLLGVSPTSDPTNTGMLKPAVDINAATWEVVPMTLDCVHSISSVRVKLPEDLKSAEKRFSTGRSIQEVKKRFMTIPLLDPLVDMKVPDKDGSLAKLVDKEHDLTKRWQSHKVRQRPDFEELSQKFQRKVELAREKKALQDELKRVRSLLQEAELTNRKRVLRRLMYAVEGDTITKKGTVACEISAADELVLTEMLFGGFFSPLTVAQTAAVLSCFVFQEKTNNLKLSEELNQCFGQVKEYARRVAKVAIECKLEVVEEEFVEGFKPGMMEVAMNWCNGMNFSEILKKTDIFEGSIIRGFRRLEELLRQMVGAAKAMDNKELEQKFEDARVAIKKDIVFANSLYL